MPPCIGVERRCLVEANEDRGVARPGESIAKYRWVGQVKKIAEDGRVELTPF